MFVGLCRGCGRTGWALQDWMQTYVLQCTGPNRPRLVQLNRQASSFYIHKNSRTEQRAQATGRSSHCSDTSGHGALTCAVSWGALRGLQQPAIGPYPTPEKSLQYSRTTFKINFNIIIPIKPIFFASSFSFIRFIYSSVKMGDKHCKVLRFIRI
jgi:hypothetical protein